MLLLPPPPQKKSYHSIPELSILWRHCTSTLNQNLHANMRKEFFLSDKIRFLGACCEVHTQRKCLGVGGALHIPHLGNWHTTLHTPKVG